CVAGGPSVVLDSTDPADPASWSGGQLPSGEHIKSLSCPTTAFCVGVDPSSPMLISTNPAVGASTWTPTNVASVHGLGTVSCATASLCFAAWPGGDVAPSLDP